MFWPTPQDYNEAIQNPRLSFRDPELQQGQPELTALGLPRPITGAFATVYKLQCRQRTWAVRCFLHPSFDHERRYAAISDQLNRVRLPCTVGFTFLREGIRVRGQWYPILKMEWVQGEPLDAFIRKHLVNSNTILSLARRWVEMMQALRDASIAHGDLQHGNVLVTSNGQLRLVDYDGMYVPALSGQGSHEVGHRNYQHPLRTKSDFGPYLDNFSAWVIYVSLIALAIDPGLWQKFSGGDECLLFRRKDFEQPEASDVLCALESHPDDRIRSAATLFKSPLYLGPRNVPSLDAQPPPDTLPLAAIDSGRASWIEDHIRRHARAPAPDATPILLRSSVAAERALLALSATWIVLFTRLNLWFVGVLSAMLLNLIFWIYRYCSDGSVRARRDLAAKARAIENHIRAARIELFDLERCRQYVQERGSKEEARLEALRKTLEAEEKREIQKASNELQAQLLSIEAKRQHLDGQKGAEIWTIIQDIQAKVQSLNAEIAALEQREARELKEALQAKQQQHIEVYLRQFRLEDASIPGIGFALRNRLIRSGFHTAADVGFDRVQCVAGIGRSRALAVVDWRRSLEARARTTMPFALADSERAPISAKYVAWRWILEQLRDAEQQRRKKEEEKILARYRLLLERLGEERNAADAKGRAVIRDIRARYAQKYQEISVESARLARETADELREIDGKSNEARDKLFDLHWEEKRLSRELGRYAGIGFWKYVKRVFLDWQAA
ncbi:MAG: hypothetical protein KatS3mg109_1767 [Pirellulaceae bacterium]|nr:MAG: hypothetical protein KatS3mg109_1767 [Pirellulaceae bacterium]